nr:hypothetical protein [uncultured Roseateles sp.]
MAKQLDTSDISDISDISEASTKRSARRSRLLSPSQLQAYLLARETLRRLKGPSRPVFARDPSTRPTDAGPSPQDR